MSTTVKAVTARKRHLCDDAWSDVHIIAAGHRYLRHVAFPGDDVNPWTRPIVHRQCAACAEDRARSDVGACLTHCCGVPPCALPLKHDGDHSCRRCAKEITRA